MTAHVDKLQVRCRTPQSRRTTSCARFLRTPTGRRLRRAVKTVEHPIAVGELLNDDRQPPTVVVTGLLQDVLEDTDVTSAELH
jgi:(p)ppGpp synthase/HD superfamily hydrolase